MVQPQQNCLWHGHNGPTPCPRCKRANGSSTDQHRALEHTCPVCGARPGRRCTGVVAVAHLSRYRESFVEPTPRARRLDRVTRVLCWILGIGAAILGGVCMLSGCEVQPLPIPGAVDLDKAIWGNCQTDADCDLEAGEVCFRVPPVASDPKPYVNCEVPCETYLDCLDGERCAMLIGEREGRTVCVWDG